MIPKHDIKGYSLIDLIQIDDIENILEEKMGLPLQNASKTESKRGEEEKDEGASGGSARLNLKGS